MIFLFGNSLPGIFLQYLAGGCNTLPGCFFDPPRRLGNFFDPPRPSHGKCVIAINCYPGLGGVRWSPPWLGRDGVGRKTPRQGFAKKRKNPINIMLLPLQGIWCFSTIQAQKHHYATGTKTPSYEMKRENRAFGSNLCRKHDFFGIYYNRRPVCITHAALYNLPLIPAFQKIDEWLVESAEEMDDLLTLKLRLIP